MGHLKHWDKCVQLPEEPWGLNHYRLLCETACRQRGRPVWTTVMCLGERFALCSFWDLQSHQVYSTNQVSYERTELQGLVLEVWPWARFRLLLLFCLVHQAVGRELPPRSNGVRAQGGCLPRHETPGETKPVVNLTERAQWKTQSLSVIFKATHSKIWAHDILTLRKLKHDYQSH